MPKHETSNNFLKMIYNFHFSEKCHLFREIKVLVAVQNRATMMRLEIHFLVNKPHKLN